MSSLLRDYPFQTSYGPAHDRLHDFYIPALARSVRYDRASGYFSSAALAVAAAGIARLIQNGGRMRLLVGARLDPEDVAAIERGYDLAERIEQRFVAQLQDPEDLLMRQRLEALAWMVASGTLEIRVVLPVGPDGRPLPGDQAQEYYHAKEGIFTDAAGNQIAFSGSINESEVGWRNNYEQFLVFTSWDRSDAYLEAVVQRFERLWEGMERGWIALPIPRAVRERLIAFRPDEPPGRDPLEREPAPVAVAEEPAVYAVEPRPDDDQRARLLVQYLRDAPLLPRAERLGAATAAVEPWPHQLRVSDAIVERFPSRFLIADEVGLGKTVEAGLAIRQLLLSGRVRRCLILTPRSVMRQWQEELYEKFLLDVPRYDGGRFVGVFGEEREPTTPNPFDSEPVLLASSQLVKRSERQSQILTALPWDLIVVDEAHHARRREFQTHRDRPNRLLELLRKLRDRTQGMLLLTATPMQVDPVEVWDLLTLLGLGGRWGADEQNFLRFYRELRKPFDEVDWGFVFAMVRDELESGGREDQVLAQTARQRISPVDWDRVRETARSGDVRALKHLPDAAQKVAYQYARRHTPLRRLMFRNTRALLREYARRGLVQAQIPRRDPCPIWIAMTPEERDLYERIEEYIAEFYARYEQERRGLGFVMTVYRRRLTSSFAAIERSLERRLDFLLGRVKDLGLTEDDVEEAELALDIDEELSEALKEGYQEEIRYIEQFLDDVRRLASDSKLERLMGMLGDIFRERETVVIFTQYTDTMDSLREALREVYGSQVACYSGRGGEEWRGGEWVPTTKEEIKNAFREGDRIKILLCTEAASEGLNLQTCGVLINYDMPWNPMRVEQRIGRVDRLGQRYPVVWVRNFFYQDTIEARVYERLSDRIDWFTEVVGDLQPILTRVSRSIETLAMLGRAERERRLEAEIAELRAEIDHQDALLHLDDDLDPELEVVEVAAYDAKRGEPVRLADLERVLTQAPPLRERFKPHPEIPNAWLLAHGDGQVAVTFDREAFDAHPDTLRLISYGDRLLDDLLAQVAPPSRASGAAGILCCAADDPVPLRAYYRPVGRQARGIDRLVDLEQALDADLTWSPDARAAAEADFGRHLAEIAKREATLAGQRREAERLALEERGRQLLLRAALIEIARGRAPDLFGTQRPLPFSEDAVRAVASSGYPFAPLLRMVDVRGLAPSPTDPYYREIEGASQESLRRRFEQLKNDASQLVQRLGELRQATPASGSASPTSAPSADLLAPPMAEAHAVSGLPAARAASD